MIVLGLWTVDCAEATHGQKIINATFSNSKGTTIHRDETSTVSIEFSHKNGETALKSPEITVELGEGIHYVANTVQVNGESIPEASWLTETKLVASISDLDDNNPKVILTFDIEGKPELSMMEVLKSLEGTIIYSIAGENYLEETGEAKIELFPLELGWEIGNQMDSITYGSNKIEWHPDNGAWLYTYSGNSFLRNNELGMNLIEDGKVMTHRLSPSSISPETFGIFEKGQTSPSSYFLNRNTRELLRSVPDPTNKYRVDIIQRIDDATRDIVTYRVTNRQEQEKQVGVTQRMAQVPNELIPSINFKGFKSENKDNRLNFSWLGEQGSFTNWAAGEGDYMNNFAMYLGKSPDSVGWETGYRHMNSYGNLLPTPAALVENKAIYVGGKGLTMKSPSVGIQPGASHDFVQRFRFSSNLFGPDVWITLAPEVVTLYQDQTYRLRGKFQDYNNQDFKLYLEQGDYAKTLVELGSFRDVPYGTELGFEVEVQGKDLALGKHEVQFVAINEEGGVGRTKQRFDVLEDLEATPVIQYIEIGASIDNTVATLFKDVKGRGVHLKEPLKVDSSKIGFQRIDATLKDVGGRERVFSLPINVYDPLTTQLNKTANLALDAKNTTISIGEVRNGEATGKLDEVVLNKLTKQSWMTDTGETLPIVLQNNPVAAKVGNYSVVLRGEKGAGSDFVEKLVNIEVLGELAFDRVPTKLVFQPTVIKGISQYVPREQADWEIAINNTMQTSWKLMAAVTPFENSQGEQLSNLLIYRDESGNEQQLTSNNIQIATGTKDETYPKVSWANNRGLLLKVPTTAKLGEYRSRVTWTLMDAP